MPTLSELQDQLGSLRGQTSRILRDPTYAHDPKTQIALLKTLEQDSYQPLLQKLAYAKSPDELKLLTEVLDDLGTLAKEVGALSDIVTQGSGIKHYTDSAVFHQYVISILSEKIDPSKADEAIQIKIGEQQQKVGLLKQSITSVIAGDTSAMPLFTQTTVEESLSHKQLLHTLREDSKRRVEETERHRIEGRDELYVTSTTALFEDITSTMKLLLSNLYQESAKDLLNLGITPPCVYSIIGLGSIAMKQATPYSDLEFAIVTENDLYKQSDDSRIRDYFENLSHLVRFKVINTGETKISNALSHLIHRGVAFDAGGHTPLGSVDISTSIPLIGTVGALQSLATDRNGRDKLLPYILSKTCHISGNRTLSDAYQYGVNEHLRSKIDPYDESSPRYCEERALNILKSDVEEARYQYDKQEPDMHSSKARKGNLEEFRPLAGSSGRLLNVKQDIYRLPDRLLHHLGSYYMQDGDSIFETVDKLHQSGIINAQAAAHLRYAASFASMLRLKTYLANEGHREDLSLFANKILDDAGIEQTAQVLHLSQEDLLENGGLCRYFYIALEFHERLEEFCAQCSKTGSNGNTSDSHTRITELEQIACFFKEQVFYVDSLANKGLIYYRLGRHAEAQYNLEQAIQRKPGQESIYLRDILGTVYDELGLADKAIEQLQLCLEAKILIYKNQLNLSIASTLKDLGSAYKTKGDYSAAIAYYTQSLEIYKSLYTGERHDNIAQCYSNLGSAYESQGDYDTAIECHSRSLDIRRFIHKNIQHHVIAASLHNLGVSYDSKGDYDKAIDHHTQSLEMQNILYKGEPHPDIAACLNSLGTSYHAKGAYAEAIEYYTRSIKVYKILYKGLAYPHIATLLYNIAGTYMSVGDYDMAVEYCTQSFEMRKLVYQDQPHHAIASTCNGLGSIYYSKGDYDMARVYYTRSLEIARSAHKDQPHTDIAMSLYNLGNVCDAKGEHDQSIEYYNLSLEMRRIIYKGEPHPDIATCLNVLGEAYRSKGEYDRAIDYHMQSLSMQRVVYKDQPNPDIAMSLNNLGNVYCHKGDYGKAIWYYTECVNIMQIIHKGEPNPIMAQCLCNLGNAYGHIGERAKEIECHSCSLEMKQLIHKNQPHSSIAVTLNNLGEVYRLKGDYDRAIEYHTKSLEMNNIVHKGQPHPDIALSLQNLGSTYNDKGEYAKAVDYHRMALQAITPFPDHHYVRSITHSLNLASAKFTKSQAETQQHVQETTQETSAKTSASSTIEKATELRKAVLSRDPTMVQKALDEGADANMLVQNKPPLTLAVMIGQESTVAILAQVASVDRVDSTGTTPLCYALVGYGGLPIKMPIINLLLGYGADPNKPTIKEHNTPMHMAHHSGHKEAIARLIAAGGRLDTQNLGGKTPLHCLLENTKLSSEVKADIIRTFLPQYALTTPDKDGNTPIDLAAAHLPEMLEVMMSALSVSPAALPDSVSVSQADTIALHPLGESASGASNAEHHDGA